MNSALNLCIYAIGTLQHRGISPRLSRLRLSPHGVTSAGETTKAKEMWPILNLLLILAKSQRLSCFLELGSNFASFRPRLLLVCETGLPKPVLKTIIEHLILTGFGTESETGARGEMISPNCD